MYLAKINTYFEVNLKACKAISKVAARDLSSQKNEDRYIKLVTVLFRKRDRFYQKKRERYVADISRLLRYKYLATVPENVRDFRPEPRDLFVQKTRKRFVRFRYLATVSENTRPLQETRDIWRSETCDRFVSENL